MSRSKGPLAPNKVVHVTECLAAGTLTFLLQITQELAAGGLQQVLIYSRRPDTPANVEALFGGGVKLLEIASPKAGLGRYFARLREVMLEQCETLDETAFHLHSSKAGFVGRMALLGLRRMPRVFYSPHGLSFLNRRLLLPSLAFAGLEWLASRVPATLVGCSRSEARLLGRLAGRPARVLENAVDDSFFGITRRESEMPLVVSMGRICYQKAPELFAAMATRFQIAETRARFVWIGDGDAEGEALLRAAGVTVTGWVGRDDVQRLLGEASLYVQTSRWEGMPLSVLQALAAGVPCVVTDAVGNRDAVRQGLTGYVVGSSDELLMAVRRLLSRPVLRGRMAQAARRDAQERFSSASFRERLWRLYGLHDTAADARAETSGKLLAFSRRASRISQEALEPARHASRV